MAISTDDPTGKASVSTELKIEDKPDLPAQSDSAENRKVVDKDTSSADGSALFFETFSKVNSEDAESDRKEEVTALLGMEMISDDEEPKILPDEEAVDQATASEDTANNEDEADKVASTAINVESGNSAAEHAAAAAELKIIVESLQDSLANTQYISSKIDAVSGDTEGLVKQVNSISLNYEMLSAEIEAITSSANSKNFLSKTFLIIASLAVAVLVIFQIYSFISLVKIQRLQNAAGTKVLENVNVLNKKMADYDKNLTKALENTATAEKTNQESAGNKEVGSANNTPVLAKMNKLRNGLPEKKLIRKETGDWFVFDKKTEEIITDVEVIKVLNQAYKKIGRSLSPTVPLPSHKALCILKPDGKGGTEVVMTKEFTP